MQAPVQAPAGNVTATAAPALASHRDPPPVSDEDLLALLGPAPAVASGAAAESFEDLTAAVLAVDEPVSAPGQANLRAEPGRAGGGSVVEQLPSSASAAVGVARPDAGDSAVAPNKGETTAPASEPPAVEPGSAPAQAEDSTAPRASAGRRLLSAASPSQLGTVKTVTHLVATVSIQQRGAPAHQKAEALTDILVQAHRLGRELADAARPDSDNSGWAEGVCTGVLAEWLAEQARAGAPLTVEELEAGVSTARELYARAGGEPALGAALKAVRAADYRRATDQDIARDRISLSLSTAVWRLHGDVSRRVRTPAGDPYTFGLDAVAVVERLARGVVGQVGGLALDVTDLDASVCRIQSGISRLVPLIGDQYVAMVNALLKEQVAAGGEPDELDGTLQDVVAECQAQALRLYQAVDGLVPGLMAQTNAASAARAGSRSALAVLSPPIDGASIDPKER